MMLEEQFDVAMQNIYDTAAVETSTPPTQFLVMLRNLGGVETARLLVDRTVPTEGYIRLWEEGRLDLTVEALIIQERWQALFEARVIQIAGERLIHSGYDMVEPPRQ